MQSPQPAADSRPSPEDEPSVPPSPVSEEEEVDCPELEIFENSDIQIEAFLYDISDGIGRDRAFRLILLCHELMFHSMDHPCPDYGVVTESKEDIAAEVEMIDCCHIPLEAYEPYGVGTPFVSPDDDDDDDEYPDGVCLSLKELMSICAHSTDAFWERFEDDFGQEALYLSKLYLPDRIAFKLCFWVHHLKLRLERRDYGRRSYNLDVTHFLWDKICSTLIACGDPLLPLTDPKGILCLPTRCGRLTLKSGNYIPSKVRDSIILELCPFRDHPLRKKAVKAVKAAYVKAMKNQIEVV